MEKIAASSLVFTHYYSTLTGAVRFQFGAVAGDRFVDGSTLVTLFDKVAGLYKHTTGTTGGAVDDTVVGFDQIDNQLHQ